MSRGLIIPASFRDPLKIIEDLEPMSTESYQAALGGGVELRGVGVTPMWREHLCVFCCYDLTGQVPLNRRAQWFVAGGYVRGDVLFTGVAGEDLPIQFLSYLDDNRLMGSTLEI